MSEHTNTNLRPYYIAVVLSSNFFSILMNHYFFQEFKNWILVFIIYILAAILISILIYQYVIESPRYYLITNNFQELKKSITSIAKTNNKNINEVANFSDLYLLMKSTYDQHDNDYENEGEHEGLTRASNTIEEVIIKNNERKLLNKNSLYGLFKLLSLNELLRFWSELAKFKILFQNLILLIIFQLLLPSISSGTAINLKEYYKTHPDLWYQIPLIEFVVKFVSAYLMNIPLFGRKYTKIVFLVLIIKGCIFSSFLDPKSDKVYYFVCLTSISADALNFINNVHMIEMFPTIFRIKAISALALTARFGTFLFPVVFSKFNDGFSNLIIIYALVGILVTIPTTETANLNLKNYPVIENNNNK